MHTSSLILEDNIKVNSACSRASFGSFSLFVNVLLKSGKTNQTNEDVSSHSFSTAFQAGI